MDTLFSPESPFASQTLMFDFQKGGHLYLIRGLNIFS